MTLQIIKFIERILYATDEREAKEAMLEAQDLYASTGTGLQCNA